MKRIVSFLLSIVMICSMLPAQAFAEEIPDTEAVGTAEETTATSAADTEAAQAAEEPTEATEAAEEETAATEEPEEFTKVMEESTAPADEMPGAIPSEEPVLASGTYNQQYLADQINAGQENLEVPEDVHLVIDSNFTVPNSVWKLEIHGSVTVLQNVTLTLNTETHVNGNGALYVENGGSLFAGGGVWLWFGGTFSNQGAYDGGVVCKNYQNGQYVGEISGVPTDMQALRFFVNSEEELQEAEQIMDATDYSFYYILIQDSFTLTQKAVIPDNCLVHMNGSITVSSGIRLSMYGHFLANENYTLENQGTIDVYGRLDVYGTVQNNGTVNKHGTISILGSWYGNDPVSASTLSQAELEAGLAAAASEGYGYDLNTSIVLEDDLTLPTSLYIQSGVTLEVPAGVTLDLKNGDVVIVPGGAVKMYGDYITHSNDDGWFSTFMPIGLNGQILGSVTGVDPSDISPDMEVTDAASFYASVDCVTDAGHEYAFISVYEDITLNEDVTIPDCGLIHLYADVTIGADATLTNNGEFYVWQNRTLTNQGTFVNNRHLGIFGQLVNTGLIELDRRDSLLMHETSGVATNSGTVNAYSADSFNILGTWNGNPISLWTEKYIQDQIDAGATSVSVPRGVDLIIEKDFAFPDSVRQFNLDGSITIPSGVTLTIPGTNLWRFGSILIEEGGTLNAREIWMQDGGGTVENHGTFDGIFVCSQYINGSFTGNVTGIPMNRRALWIFAEGSEAEFDSALQIAEENTFDCYFISVSDGFTPSKPVTLPEDRYFNIAGDMNLAYDLTIPAGSRYQIINDSTLTVGENATLTIDGVLEAFSTSVKNSGTILVNGELWLAGSLENAGAVTLSKDSFLHVFESGSAVNSGTVSARHTDNYLVEGSWSGNPIEIWNETYLQAQIDAGAEYVEVPENVHLVIEKDFAIPDSVWQLSINGSIIVPDGVTFSYPGEIHLDSDNALIRVEEGGRLETFAVYIWMNGTVQMDGTLDGMVCINYENGAYKGNVSGLDMDQLALRFFVYSEDDLREAVRIMTEEDYCFYYTLIRDDVTITSDLTLPGYYLYHLENAVLTVNEGCTLVNNGSLNIWKGAEVLNNGIIENYAECNVGGTMNNNGTFHVKLDSSLSVAAEEGAVWNGNAPVIEESPVENRLILDSGDLDGQTSVWIDGVEYAVQTDGDTSYVDLPDSNARTMVIYSYNSSLQSRYPVGMKVWMLENKDGIYSAARQEVFDDILEYSGMSIRVTGKKGIRMVTAIPTEKKTALTADGLAGLTLKEYGTAIAWANQLSSTNPLTLGQSYVKSNYAYRKDTADLVFQQSASIMQYTNVLVNFSNEQCKNDIALRPYMILEDENGEEVVLYGGIVYRSIGYIAYQNRNVFEPETEEYNYIWDIIHYVYGDVYDDDFIHAWSPLVK